VLVFSVIVSFQDISRLRQAFLTKFDFYMQDNVARAQKLFFRFQFGIKMWYALKFLKWLPTPFASFPFTFPPVRHRVPSHFSWSLQHIVGPVFSVQLHYKFNLIGRKIKRKITHRVFLLG